MFCVYWELGQLLRNHGNKIGAVVPYTFLLISSSLVLEYTCGALSSAEDPYRLSRQLREAFRSFPSGHANVAAYMALFSVVSI